MLISFWNDVEIGCNGFGTYEVMSQPFLKILKGTFFRNTLYIHCTLYQLLFNTNWIMINIENIKKLYKCTIFWDIRSIFNFLSLYILPSFSLILIHTYISWNPGSDYLFICPVIYNISLYLSVSLSIYLSLFLSSCLYIYLAVSISI